MLCYNNGPCRKVDIMIKLDDIRTIMINSKDRTNILLSGQEYIEVLETPKEIDDKINKQCRKR